MVAMMIIPLILEPVVCIIILPSALFMLQQIAVADNRAGELGPGGRSTPLLLHRSMPVVLIRNFPC
jgi:hypothetical protein